MAIQLYHFFTFSYLFVGVLCDFAFEVNTRYHPTRGSQSYRSDCSQDQVNIITQALSDAKRLAGQASAYLTNDNARPSYITAFYEKIFIDNTMTSPKVPVMQDISKIYLKIWNKSFRESTILFHCDPGWDVGLSMRKSGGTNAAGECGTSIAYTYTIKSGTFGSDPSADSDYGSGSAYRTGIHIMLCQKFFNYPDLANLPQTKIDDKLDDKRSKGSLVLHELFHCTADPILDGGYGYGGCVDVTNGRIASGLDKVLPWQNADTFTYFAIGCTDQSSINNYSWKTGFAQPVTPQGAPTPT